MSFRFQGFKYKDAVTAHQWKVEGERGTNPTDVLTGSSPIFMGEAAEIELQTTMKPGTLYHFAKQAVVYCTVAKICRISITHNGTTREKRLGQSQESGFKLNADPGDTVTILEVK